MGSNFLFDKIEPTGFEPISLTLTETVGMNQQLFQCSYFLVEIDTRVTTNLIKIASLLNVKAV